MEIIRTFNDMFIVINDFGQKVKTFAEFDDAFDYVKSIED